MQEINFEQTLERILRKDRRYQRDAYLFVREALDYTQRIVTKNGKEPLRHVSGQELLGGIRAFALQQFGPMAFTVLTEWGVHTCGDFGDMVFNMVEASLLSKTPSDSRDDFKGGYEFDEAFRKPFQPSLPARVPEPEPEPHSK